MYYIASSQQSNIKIIVSSDAPSNVRYAQSELRNYLELITGCVMPIGDESAEGPVIAIGDAAKRFGVEYDASLGTDGFIIRTCADSIAITGGQRGVIYAVYELLERLGCRFFTPLCEKIPSLSTLELPQLDLRQVPVLEYRHHNYRDFMKNPRFAVKSRINSTDLPDELGGGIEYAWLVHSFRLILHPDDCFAEHPEYFSLVNGKRENFREQLCLTNPEVLKIAIEKVRQRLHECPRCRIISISQNDWYNECQCEKCAEVDAYEGSSAGTLLRFVNSIAEALEGEFPDVIFDTLAYEYSRPAPLHVRPRHNVCVRLCSIEACFAHPFDTCDDETRKVKRPDGSTSSFINDLEAWGKVCNRLYIWDYTTCFCQYPAPYPNWNVLQRNMQTFIKNNVKGVFEQANGAVGGGVDMNELRAYIISKLLWDADCDVERHISEFMEFFYGDAAPYLRNYLKLLCDYVEEHNIHIGFNDNCDKPYLSTEMLDKYDKLFDMAEAAVKGDAIRLMRVAKARLAIRWVRIKNDAMERDIHDTKEINQFFEDWRAHGMTRINEWCCAETTRRALLENIWRGELYYGPHWNLEGAEKL